MGVECYNSGCGGQNNLISHLRVHETMNSQTIDEFIQRVISSLPADLGVAKQDIEKVLKTALQKSLARMDLVTREEFDVQSELLSRTRAALQELEQKLSRLEQSMSTHEK